MVTYIFDGEVTSSIFDLTSYLSIFRNRTSTEPIYIKIETIVHFDDKKSHKKNGTDSDIFDGVMTSSSFDVTSFPTISRNHTSAEPIFVKIRTIVQYDNKKSQK